MSLPGERRGDAARIGIALLMLAVSAWLVGETIALFAPQLPPERLGGEGGARIPRVAAVARIGWIALHVGAAAYFFAGTTSRRASAKIATRTTLATLLFALAGRLPLEAPALVNDFARSRLLLFTYLALCAIALVLLFRRATPPPPREVRGKPRHRSRARILVGLAIGAFAVTVLAESVIDVALVRAGGRVPDVASLAEGGRMVAINFAAVAALVGLAYALSRRPAFSLWLVAFVVALLVGCDVVKLTHRHAPLALVDLLYLREFAGPILHFLTPVRFGGIAMGLLVALLVMIRAHRRELPVGGWRVRAGTAVVAGLLLVGVGNAARFDAGRGEREWDTRHASLTRGLLFDLAVRALEARVTPPPGYSRAEMVRITAAHRPPFDATDLLGRHPDVVVLLVESLADPREFGFELSDDPLPFLRTLPRRGSSLSPASCSGIHSANAEFELLTGMSTAFLPPGSLVARQYLRRGVPSLPRVFAELDYRVAAVITDPPAAFDRASSFGHLGFGEVAWLQEGGAARRGERIEDEAVVDAILALDDGSAPFFCYAATHATRAPYDPRDFGDDAIEVRAPGSRRVARELGGYASAIRRTDRALARLVAHFRDRGRPALIVIVGDHLPPLDGPDGVYDRSRYFEGDEGERRRYSVPVWMWASFPLGTDALPTGHNFVAGRVLDAVDVAPEPWFGLVDAVRAKHPVFTRLVDPGDGTLRGFDPVRDRPKGLVRDYELFQYDLLFGERYATRDAR